MQSLISGLWWSLKYNRGLRGVADRSGACAGEVIRVGLQSVVIGSAMRGYKEH